jgi:hypothetical protein
VGYVGATWFGNDWITLGLAVPLLMVGLFLEQRHSLLGRLVWLGTLGYGAYNYAFYLFGAALNAFFPLYVVIFILSGLALMLVLSRTDVGKVRSRFNARTPVRLVGGYLVFVATGLTVVWLALWALHVFGGQPTPVEPEAFKLVAALDLTVMVPVLAGGGVLLWQRRSWGYIIAAIAGIQGTLYLLILTVNGALLIQQGLAEAPGELPVWGTLTVATGAATALLLANVRGQRGNG